MLEQLAVRSVEIGDGLEERAGRCNLPRNRKIHDPLRGVDPVAYEVAPPFEVCRFLDRAKMEARAQAVRSSAIAAGCAPIVVSKSQRHVERMLRIRNEGDQGAVAGILYPVVAFSQHGEIAPQKRCQLRFGRILLGRSSFRESYEIGKEEA